MQRARCRSHPEPLSLLHCFGWLISNRYICPKNVNKKTENRVSGLRIAACSLFLILFVMSACGQGSSGADAKLESRYLIDVPTAGIIPHGSLALDLDFFQNGGLLSGLSLGLWNRLVLGISYGGAGLIGTESPVWNKTPGFALKVRLLDETDFVPAIALGFDSQGKEFYVDRLDRYAIKSMGFFAVVSKNYGAWGFLSFHGGANYSLERGDGDDDPNFFGGIEKTIGPVASVLAEYNLGMNDSNRDALGRGRGYLNFGIRTSIGGGFTIGFNLKDVLKNQQDASVGNRTVRLEYLRQL